MSEKNKGVTIHYKRTLSLDTAKLLGVAFTWGSCGTAYKYAAEDTGPILYSCWILHPTGLREWVQQTYDIYKWDICGPIYLVTFDGGGQGDGR